MLLLEFYRYRKYPFTVGTINIMNIVSRVSFNETSEDYLCEKTFPFPPQAYKKPNESISTCSQGNGLILTPTLKLLLNLSLDNLTDTLPTSTVRNGRNAALTLLKTNEFLRENLAEAVTVLIAQGQVDCASKLSGVGRGQRDVVNTGIALDRAAGSSDTNGRVGVQNVATGLGALGTAGGEVGGEAGLVGIADSRDGLLVADTLTLELGLGGLDDGGGDLEAALGLELVQPAADALTSMLAALLSGAGFIGLEREEPEKTLEVAADQDVHGRAVGLLDALIRRCAQRLLSVVTIGTEEAVKNAIS
jgi:hypothetical protein